MSGVKKSFVLRLEEENFRILSKWAEDEFRSVNGQIEMLLSKAIKEANRDKLPAVRNFKTAKSKQ
jgi:hypothetical protein